MADEPQADTEGAAESDAAEPESSDASENPLDTEAEIAADYLEELLDIADLDGYDGDVVLRVLFGELVLRIDLYGQLHQAAQR